MKKIKERIVGILNYKYFVPVFVVTINILFFIFYNLAFELRYETVDDFTIMKIISALDGNYSVYGVYIHPVICFIIMMLYKTGININWYTVFLLVIQFISFTAIGITLLKRNKKTGTILYLVLINIYYSRLLIIINYTTIAVTAILAGIVLLMQYEKKKKKILGYILLVIGIMLRTKAIALVFPFYMVYVIFNLIEKKDFKTTKIITVIALFLCVYISNIVIYNIKPINNEFSKFNKIRTYFFDSNVLDYNKNKDIFDKVGWSYADWMLFYSYSLADENFYTTENLINLKDNLNITIKYYNDKVLEVCKSKVFNTVKYHIIIILSIIILMLFSILYQKNRKKCLICFFVYIFLFFLLCYTKTVSRVVIPMHMSAFVILSMILTENTKNIKKYENNIYVISVCVICMLIIVNCLDCYKQIGNYSKSDFTTIRSVINYTSSNKNNIYVYPNVLQNISLAYSVYEKIDDGNFSNLRHMGDWDIYNEEFYKFKQKYEIENIMTDLYKKDNVYLLDGDVAAANNVLYKNHVEYIIDYIKQHYNVEVKYHIIKEFNPYSFKIYKLYTEGE